MRDSSGVSKLFRAFKKNIRSFRSEAMNSFKKIESTAKKSKLNPLLKLSKTEKKKIDLKIAELNVAIEELQKKLTVEIQTNTTKLKTEIEKLNREKDAADSNSFLLEYKKKDLLIKTDELESAYDEISKKNKELELHQQQIDRQAVELRIANEELERKTESLLDQSDYLHEANETIENMVKKLGSQNEELISLNLEKNNLIGIVAHDLKSPLNQIKGLLTLVKMTGKVDEESAKYLEMMEQSAIRLNEMIAKILDVEAIESRQINLKMESVNISSILTNLILRYENDAVKKQIHLVPQVAQNTSVIADRGYLEQVLENLLSNAIKFSPFERNVFIKLTSFDQTVLCEIKDQGPGLSEADKKKLFGKYQKLSARPTGNEMSTGLGLSIVKKFVEAMKAEIWCESTLGEGASFFVKFTNN